MKFDAQEEHKKDYWLGITGSVLILVTIITVLLQIS